MSKEFICKGCGEKFNKDMQSNNVGYCYICNEFYMRQKISDLEAKLAESEKEKQEFLIKYKYWRTECEQLKQQLADTEFRYDNLHDLYYKDTEELKQKLANKEIEIGTWETLYGSVMKSCHNGIEEDKRLREQLAEKEKEIENLKEQFDVFTIKNAFKYQNCMEKSKMQFAIDYAIEQLEELRLSFICNYHDNISWIDDRENSCCLNLTTTIYNTTMDIFDNQIKQLKEIK